MIVPMFKSHPVLWAIALAGLITLIAGIGAGFAQGGVPGPGWLGAGILGAVTALGATVTALRSTIVKVVDAGVDRSIKKADTVRELGERLGGAKGKIPRVSEIRDRALRYGVQQAIPLDDGPIEGLSADLPRYLPRTIDGALRSALTSRSATGGLVILKGNSTWGKSRSMFEAVSQVLEDWFIVAPSKASDVRDLVESGLPLHQTVIWLDEMVDFLTGSDPITRHAVQRGVDKGAIIVGTIWKDDFAALTGQPKKTWVDRTTPLEHDSGTVDELAEPRAILTATYADLIEMPRELDMEESAVASALAKQDSRWAHALADAGELSPIQVLAAAPQLLHRYRSPDDEIGGVVLRTAVALLAMEHPQPVPAELLRQVAHAAMPPTLELDSERWFDHGLEWARRPVRGTIAPLGVYRSEATGGLGYVAPDLLVSAAREDGGLQVDLDLTQTYATAEACASIGSFFYFRDEDDLAEPFLRRAAEGGIVRAFRRYGYVLSEQEGRAAEAESWYLKAVDSADSAATFDLGYLLDGQDGRAAEAKQWYLKAVESGNTVALFNLAVLASKGGRRAEAEEWYRKAADAGETDAMINLGAMLADQGRFSEAEAFFQSAHAAGNTGAMYALGYLAAKEGRTAEAESWYLQAAGLGSVEALVNLGVLLGEQEGRAAEAEACFRKAGDAGDADALVNLGVLLEEQEGRTGEAEAFFRMAVDAGRTADALFGLGSLLADQEGRVAEAEACLRKAVDAGSTDALSALADLLADQEGRAAEAEACYRKAVDLGDEDAILGLGLVLGTQGHTDEAEEWLRKAADAGDTDALVGLGTLLFDQEGRADDADEWYRKAIDAGNPDALTHFGDALKEQGRYTEARPILERAIEGGDPYAMRMMGELDLLEGNREAGRAWLQRAASQGIKRAGEILREEFDEGPPVVK